ncbi:cytidylyltransferase domain-containing protein [Paenibacillus oryzisoli]|uniref:Acylneuraminate cytidylyltransferase n=1 Tax=Paenibacillus oryzisoli TaxID=1850517 RepID=A0A198A021_9BACL|nr:acylneuraminate cytidylyltransferase family protein [Paenibacillus oryzisoli]OAS14520.1 acylneuraminate cytidylyltransferase [Paenibacillus oryzisoli]
MIQNKKILALIPARGGSKGVPGKNILVVQDKPLIAWTIEEAKKSKYIDRVVLSSEDEEIIKVADQWGCDIPFVRPANLAKDDTPGIDPVLHALDHLPDYDYVIMLQPTSPLRSVEDIDNAIEYCFSKNALCCVSVCRTSENPYWMYKVIDGNLRPIVNDNETMYLRRQDLPPTFILNGAIYIANCNWLKESKSFLTDKTVAYIMDSARSLDIDNEIDFVLLEYYLGLRC